MDAVAAYGVALIDDPDRFGDVAAVGLDETLRCRLGRWRAQQWSAQIVDVGRGQLLVVVEGRSAAGPCAWFADQPRSWRDGIVWATLDLSGPYRKVFDTMLPDAIQVADPFHVVKLANAKLDECRRHDPLYRARRLLTKAHERLDERGETKLLGLLDAGDPRGEVRLAWHAKEVIRSIYEHRDHDLAVEFVDRLAGDLQDRSCPARGLFARPDATTMARRDRGLARRPRLERMTRDTCSSRTRTRFRHPQAHGGTGQERPSTS